VVDVFTSQPFEGNPLAVFPNAEGLSAGTMQQIARELNLSETTFVLPVTRPDCAARVRIFTPANEMVFAGHPTVGTAWVLLDEETIAAGVLEFKLEEKVGPVPIRVDAGDRPLIWLTTPAITFGQCVSRILCAELLGLPVDQLLDIPPQHLSAGNPTLFIALRDSATVDRAVLNAAQLPSLRGSGDPPFCVFAFAPTATGAYSRMFAPDYGIAEDPATGSSTGPLAAYMLAHKLASSAAGTRLVSEQGTKMGRRSLLHILIGRGSDGLRIEVGGHVAAVSDATMRLGDR
jgi:trans-2,3-dihydro-3-hydroxyanthranilate isomerase